LLDEPTNALDADGSALFLQIVDAHLAEGGVAVIATHLPMALSGKVEEMQMRELA
jgi:heme exporter protein A